MRYSPSPNMGYVLPTRWGRGGPLTGRFFPSGRASARPQGVLMRHTSPRTGRRLSLRMAFQRHPSKNLLLIGAGASGPRKKKRFRFVLAALPPKQTENALIRRGAAPPVPVESKKLPSLPLPDAVELWVMYSPTWERGPRGRATPRLDGLSACRTKVLSVLQPPFPPSP